MSYYIILRGPLGCGKSTIAERLSKEINGEYIPIDRVLDDYNLTKDKEEGYISQKSFLKANEIIVPEIKKSLNSGKPVVIDGNFYWKSQIEDLIKKLNYPHQVFTLKASLEVCIARDEERGKTHGKDAAEAVYKKSASFNYGEIIDISGSLDESVEKIKSRIKLA